MSIESARRRSLMQSSAVGALLAGALLYVTSVNQDVIIDSVVDFSRTLAFVITALAVAGCVVAEGLFLLVAAGLCAAAWHLWSAGKGYSGPPPHLFESAVPLIAMLLVAGLGLGLRLRNDRPPVAEAWRGEQAISFSEPKEQLQLPSNAALTNVIAVVLFLLLIAVMVFTPSH